MTRISLWQPAGTVDVPGKGEFPQQFSPHAWDGQVGKQIPMKGLQGEDLGLVTLVAAEVADDGSGVMLTFEGPGSHEPVTSPPGGMSFAFREPDAALELHDPASTKPPRITWKP